MVVTPLTLGSQLAGAGAVPLLILFRRTKSQSDAPVRSVPRRAQQIIDTFVNSVYVYDDRLVMTYNYKDGTETISLDAVHQAFGSDLSSDAPLQKLGMRMYRFLLEY